MSRANRYNAPESRLETDYVFTDAAGTVERSRAAHHIHTAAEVVRLLLGAGFGDVRLLGGDGTTPYALGAPRMIAIATA